MIGIRLTDGSWLKTFEPDAHAEGIPYPTGSITTTDDPAQAMTFNDHREATMFWRQKSKVQPLRPDGQPNRPLTAFTVSIEPLP